MVGPSFSEFQFGYGITKELHTGASPFKTVGQPRFPTQDQEESIGIDVGFFKNTEPILLQFKRSDKLIRGNAREARDHDYNTPYYRFKARTSDDPYDPNQHELLTRAAKSFDHTYYVAPKFVSWSDYRQYASSENINYNSVFISCEDAPTPYDDDKHYICYRRDSGVAYFFSNEEREMQCFKDVEDVYGRETEAYESFVELYDEFEDVRRSVFEYLPEQDIQTESTYDVGQNKPPQEYTTEERLEWGRQQQQFFFDTIGASLEFVGQED